jgi:hypothetical protein
VLPKTAKFASRPRAREPSGSSAETRKHPQARAREPTIRLSGKSTGLHVRRAGSGDIIDVAPLCKRHQSPPRKHGFSSSHKGDREAGLWARNAKGANGHAASKVRVHPASHRGSWPSLVMRRSMTSVDVRWGGGGQFAIPWRKTQPVQSGSRMHVLAQRTVCSATILLRQPAAVLLEMSVCHHHIDWAA